MNVNIGGGRDSFTHVTHDSVCGKLCNSFVGVFIGLAMFVAGFPLLAWNENNFIRVYESLAEGLQKVQTLEDINFIDHSFQGELVHAAGPLGNVPVLEDSEMGLSVKGTNLERVVEMYQWVEKTHKRKSGKRSVTTYTYDLEWADHVIDSSRFAHDGYDNPRSMPIKPLTRSANDVKLGAFKLRQSQVKQIGSSMHVELTPETLLLKDASTGRPVPKSGKRGAASLPEPVDERDPYGDDGFDYDGEEDPQAVDRTRRPQKGRKGARSRKASRRNAPARRHGNGLVPAAPGAQDMVLSDDALYLADNPHNPQWGDVRVTWRVRDPSAATVIGVQSGREIRPYKASNGYAVHLVLEGELTAEEAFEDAHSENSMFTWMLRAGGYLLMAIGLRMVLEPAVVAPQLVPLVGGLVSSIVACGACMASMSVALVFTLVTVAVAWFAVRPTLSVTLLAIAGATALFASLFRSKNSSGANTQKND